MSRRKPLMLTVSSRQAKVTFINSQWTLTSFARDTSNPTRHTSVDLPVDGQVALKDGDRVEMTGAVKNRVQAGGQVREL